MNDDHEVDWGNDEDVPMLPGEYYNSVGMDHGTGGAEPDDVEDAVSLGGDEEEEFAAYGARSNEQNSPSADKVPTALSKRDARPRSASVGVSPKKEMSRDQPSPLPPSPQSEIRQSNPKLTHALPPKPVVSSSIRAPPSTTAASPMSLPRKERRSNGSISKKGDEPLPSPLDRETISSRTTAGRDGRQRDSHADETPWAHPGSGDTDSQSLHRDRTRGFVERDGRPPSRREDDYYRPSHRQAPYSSDEEGREPYSHREQSHIDRDARYRYDDRDRYHDYASGDRTDRPIPRSARLSPEDEAVDRSRTGYRESNDPDTRRAHPRDRDRDASPVRDDSARRVLRRDAYLYDSSDKGSRDFDDPPRRGTGTAERSRYPETFNGRTNSVGLRDSHTHNQGPGRSSTLRRNSPSPRPRSRSPPYNRRDDRRHSPTRYPEYPSDPSRLPHYRGRVESPPPRLRGSDRLDRRDTPPDLPQRRPRGISDARDPDYVPKRRKMDDDDGNFPPVRRGTVGADTHIPLETSPASASPRSTGPLDDLSRQRRREPLPPQSHRYKEASDFTSRPPPSGSNRAIPQPQASAQGHRSYPPSSKDPGVPSSRQPNTDTSRLDRSRGSGHDPGHAYVDKFSRDDHMKGDPHYSSRGVYEEPPRVQGLAIRTSSHDDALNRGPRINAAPASPSLITPTRMIVENVRGRSRDRSPRGHREPRQMSTQSLSASLPAMQPGPPQDMQFVEDHRPRGRRIDRDREGHSPTLQRFPSNLAAPKSRSTGRYDGLEGGQRSLRSPEPQNPGHLSNPPRSPHAAHPQIPPSVKEQPRHHSSNASNPRRERQAPRVPEANEIPSLGVSSDPVSMSSSTQVRASRFGPPPDAELPPPVPIPATPVPPAREWIPKQPEFMSSLPPPSTRLPGAPPPPILPPNLFNAPRDPLVHSRLPRQDENISSTPESQPNQLPPQEKYRPEPPLPTQQEKDVPPPPSFQTQGHHEQVPLKTSERVLRPTGGDGLKENTGEERHLFTTPEDRRPKVPSETVPASWDRPRDAAPAPLPTPTPKPLILPASLPPKPVAALGDLNLPQSSSVRGGHPSRGRRSQQQVSVSDEGNSHSARWGSAPREGGREKDREKNRWGQAPEYRGPSLLARMSSGDVDGTEVVERGGGEMQRKRARSRKYHGV